ncbi:unnamed protein product [Aureobasidium mustum]|uniref:Uncharacterized protein n=1 Tax=Aureobasidium mustum TaxID=2773714 RepID=A0A9N8PI60_9PEZI|nr:unnamed protein product [Aureobasidium mustum]
MFLRSAWIASSLVVQAAQALNNNYRWTVDSIIVNSITSLEADTLTLFATVTHLGGEFIARKSVFLGDVMDQDYLTQDQINFDIEFSAPSASNISIIWSLVNSANANHTFTHDIQQLSNATMALADNSEGILDDIGGFSTKIPELMSPEVLGITVGAYFGPVGILIGAMVGAIIDNALGTIIDDIFGCDCAVASDTVVILPGDLPLLPIPLTTTYHRSGKGIGCQESSYTISSTLNMVQANHDNVATSLKSTTNWTISLLDTNAPLYWNILNAGDTLYSGEDSPQTWTPAGHTAELWGTPWWATIDSGNIIAIAAGQRTAFGTYSDPNRALPSNLQNDVFLATACGRSQLFLSGLWNDTFHPTAEAYIVDYARNKTLKIPDAPFPVDKWGGDGLVCTESWSKQVLNRQSGRRLFADRSRPKVFLFHANQMAYYDLTSGKWSTVTTLPMVIGDWRFAFDGLNTIIFGSTLPLVQPLIQYGADSQGLIQSVLTLVLDENEPSKARFVSHPVTPFLGVDGGAYNYSNGDSPPYLFAINMDPQAAADREARFQPHEAQLHGAQLHGAQPREAPAQELSLV